MGLREKINYFMVRQKFSFTVENHLNKSINPRVELDFGGDSENIEILSCGGERVNVKDVVDTVKELGSENDIIEVIVKDGKSNSEVGRVTFPNNQSLAA